jgi:adenine C2-methylase RlmN of 23S rRNA A2503 and tRNA A37
MDCPFCATGQAGLTRNLTAAEITAQVVAAAKVCEAGELKGGPIRLSNVVFMGMGEPLANYNAVIQSVRNITAPAPDGLGIGARSVTLSTVGLVPGIEKLIRSHLQFLYILLMTNSVTLWCRSTIAGKLKKFYKQLIITLIRPDGAIRSNMR